MLLKPVPIVFRKSKPPARRTSAPAPPAALVLVSAVYQDGEWVRLVFDRAIDVAALDGSQIFVQDGNGLSTRYAATGAVTTVGADGVQLGLVALGGWTDPGVLLNASAATGIVAANDGGAWAGVAGVELPWP